MMYQSKGKIVNCHPQIAVVVWVHRACPFQVTSMSVRSLRTKDWKLVLSSCCANEKSARERMLLGGKAGIGSKGGAA